MSQLKAQTQVKAQPQFTPPTQRDAQKLAATTRVIVSFSGLEGGFELTMHLRLDIMDRYSCSGNAAAPVLPQFLLQVRDHAGVREAPVLAAGSRARARRHQAHPAGLIFEGFRTLTPDPSPAKGRRKYSDWLLMPIAWRRKRIEQRQDLFG